MLWTRTGKPLTSHVYLENKKPVMMQAYFEFEGTKTSLSYISSFFKRLKDDRLAKKMSNTQLSSVTGGGVPVDLHKLGDISIGPVKIPIGTIVSYVTKLFGGNYVTGALQQYGPVNKIVLKLEKRPIFYKQNPEVCFFEVTWPSETIKTTDIAEGVPQAIEELGYLITLNITEGIDTKLDSL